MRTKKILGETAEWGVVVEDTDNNTNKSKLGLRKGLNGAVPFNPMVRLCALLSFFFFFQQSS